MKTIYGPCPMIVFAFVLVAVFCGCVGTATPPQPIYYYTVDYPPPGHRLTPLAPVALRVERFSASPPYDSQRIVYADNGPHRNTYAYHQWIARPGDLLPYLVARDLRNTGGFQAVFAPDAAVRTTHRLHGWIEHFLEEDHAEGWTAEIVLHITLISDTALNPTERIVMQKRYVAQAPCKDETPASLAMAMAIAMAQISESIATDVHAALLP